MKASPLEDLAGRLVTIMKIRACLRDSDFASVPDDLAAAMREEIVTAVGEWRARVNGNSQDPAWLLFRGGTSICFDDKARLQSWVGETMAHSPNSVKKFNAWVSSQNSCVPGVIANFATEGDGGFVVFCVREGWIAGDS